MYGCHGHPLGGGVAQGGDLLFDAVRASIRERVRIFDASDVEIVPAELGVAAGAIGAAFWGADRAAAA